MYTFEKRIRALEMYKDTRSITETIHVLGYNGRQTLYKWIGEQNQPKKAKSTYRGENTPSHPRHSPADMKMEPLHRCFELGEDLKSASVEIGYSRASIYTWRREYLRKGITALMNLADDPRGNLTPGTASASEEISELKTKVQNMQMQIDILQEIINVLEKDPGVDQTASRNREKAAIIDALKDKYSLPNLLAALHFSRSSYYYQMQTAKQQDKYGFARERIEAAFKENHRRYGYRRIHAVLRKEGLRLSEKVGRRLMKKDELQVAARKKRSYTSYQGEITPATPNILQRSFYADLPNEKWLTDIIEFAIPAGKGYLSLVIDCFDGLPLGWSIGTAPNAEIKIVCWTMQSLI